MSLLIGGVAQAQPADDPTRFVPDVTVSVDSDSTPLMPVSGVKEIPWTVQATCEVPQVPPTSPVSLEFEAIGPDVAAVVIDKTTAPIAFESYDCVNGVVHTVKGIATVFFDANAPAAEEMPFSLLVRYEGDEVAHAEWAEVPAAYAEMGMKLDRTIVKIDRGETIAFILSFDLETNTPLDVCFHWVEPQWDVDVPACVDGGPEGAESIAFDVVSPEDVQTGIYAFSLRGTASGLADDSDHELDAHQVTALVRVVGFPRSAQELPLPAAPAVLLSSLTALAVAVARRQ